MAAAWCPAKAQVVKHERLLSFEGTEVPADFTAENGALGINDEHYKDGKHCLSWKFEPGAVLSLKRDLKFERKDPTGKDTYLSAFIVWVYSEQAHDKQIEFQFLKDGKVCASFPFGINFVLSFVNNYSYRFSINTIKIFKVFGKKQCCQIGNGIAFTFHDQSFFYKFINNTLLC